MESDRERKNILIYLTKEEIYLENYRYNMVVTKIRGGNAPPLS